MSTSYQDIDSRLRTVEDKLKLVMRVASVTKKAPSTIMPGEFITEQMSLEDLYREIQTSGGIV
jgi:protein involved in sex pheromone biosynthesis